MSSQSNVISQLKGFLHGAGANASDAAAAVQNVHLEHVALHLGAGVDGTNANFANSHVTFAPAVDRKLVAVKLLNKVAVTNVAGDDIVITVITNGATVVTYNTNSAANGSANIAVNSCTDLGINTANSFANANTVTRVAWTQADAANNTLRDATFVLVFAPY